MSPSITVVKSEQFDDELVFVYDHWLEKDSLTHKLKDCHVLGPSILGHHRAIFTGNKFGGASMSVVPLEGHYVEGVLHLMTGADLRRFSFLMGIQYLPKKTMFPTGADSPEVEATYFYHRDMWDTVGLPSRSHMAGVINGYREHDLDLEELKDAVYASCG